MTPQEQEQTREAWDKLAQLASAMDTMLTSGQIHAWRASTLLSLGPVLMFVQKKMINTNHVQVRALS